MDNRKGGPVHGLTEQELIDILTAVFDEYATNNHVVFDSEGKRAGVYHDYLNRRERGWERSRQCMYPDCAGRSISRSHTIPRASLELIAEYGHVLQPRLDKKSHSIALERVGLGKASVFPGYCLEHEQVFQSFERDLRIECDADYVLQTFRTCCREMAIKEHHARWLDTAAAEFKKRLYTWGRDRLITLVAEHGKECPPKAADDFDIMVEGDIIHTFTAAAAKIRADLHVFKAQLFDPLLSSVAGKSALTLPVRHMLVRPMLPIALAGRSSFAIGVQGVKHETHVILNALPAKHGTEVFICASSEQHLQRYINWMLADTSFNDGIVGMVESWMLHGSDHWFMTPSKWCAIPSEQQKEILSAIKDTNTYISAKPRMRVL